MPLWSNFVHLFWSSSSVFPCSQWWGRGRRDGQSFWSVGMPFLLPAIHSDIYPLQIYTVATLELYYKNIQRISVKLQQCTHIHTWWFPCARAASASFSQQALSSRVRAASRPTWQCCVCFRHIEIDIMETIHLKWIFLKAVLNGFMV